MRLLGGTPYMCILKNIFDNFSIMYIEHNLKHNFRDQRLHPIYWSMCVLCIIGYLFHCVESVLCKNNNVNVGFNKKE